MNRIRVTAGLGLVVLLGGTAPPVSGQDAGDVTAFLALLFTPVGALPPVARAPMLQGGSAGGAFQVRYGRYEFDGSGPAIHNIGIGGDFQRGTGRVGITVGLQTCDGCDGTLMLGLDYVVPVLQRVIGGDPSVPNASVVAIALNPSAGVARPLDSEADATFFSAAVGLPVSLAARVGARAQLIPFVTPGFGVGLIAGEGDSDSGVRFTLGGGMGLAHVGPGVGLTLGFQKIFIENGPTQWGLGFTWHGPPR